MIYIIEGPDASGKSTLLKTIRDARKPNSYFLSSATRPRSLRNLQIECHWIETVPLHVDLFCDRHRMVSEPIYGSILRGQSIVDDKEYFLGLQHKYRFIYCRPPLDTIRAQLNSNPQLGGVTEHIEDIVKAYDELFDRYSANHFMVYRYDYTQSNPWIEDL